MKYHQRQSVIVGIWTNHSNGWLTKAQGRLFHEATRQSHPLTGAEIFRDPLEVLYPFPFEEWITWFSFWIKAMKSGLLDLSGSLWIPKLQINQSFHSNGHMCISRGSIALQQHVRPSFWSSWWVVSWSNFRYCAYQTTEIVSIQQRVHSYLRSVHLSSTWYFKLYIYVHTHIYIILYKPCISLCSDYTDRTWFGGNLQLGDGPFLCAEGAHEFSPRFGYDLA